jgi:hypothetical protein
MTAEDAVATEGASSRGGGQYTPTAYPEEARELTAERITAAGVTMRAHILHYDQSYGPFGGGGDADDAGWAPAPWCYPSADLRITIVAPSSANISWAPWYTEPKDGLAVATFSTGYIEDEPMFGIVAQVAADATGVTFTTASGATDTATPMNGLALLIVAGGIEENFSVEVERAGGSPIAANAGDLTQSWVGNEFRDACEPPPPALPPAGEQPTDPVAAEEAVRDSWTIAHDLANSAPDRRASFVDDATGVVEAWEALHSGTYAEAARTSTTTIRELVFTSPTEAWFRYDIETSITNFFDRYGMARLEDDGIWRITRQTICQDVALAPGFGCTPSVAPLHPPSAADDPRYGGGSMPEVITEEG